MDARCMIQDAQMVQIPDTFERRTPFAPQHVEGGAARDLEEEGLGRADRFDGTMIPNPAVGLLGNILHVANCGKALRRYVLSAASCACTSSANKRVYSALASVMVGIGVILRALPGKNMGTRKKTRRGNWEGGNFSVVA